MLKDKIKKKLIRKSSTKKKSKSIHINLLNPHSRLWDHNKFIEKKNHEAPLPTNLVLKVEIEKKN
jgi:hypothetical protein